MKIEFNRGLKKLDGKDLMQPLPNGTETKDPATLKSVTTNALLANFSDELTLPGSEKADRYNLAMRINASLGAIEVSIEELALIKKLIGKGFGPLYVGQAYLMLETSLKEVEELKG